MNYIDKISKYISEEIDVLKQLDKSSIDVVMNKLEEARINHKKVFICGNGGSAATASHFCCDFNKGVNEKNNDKYNFECLSDNVPTMMAIANDISYDEIFREQLKTKMNSGDVVIGISGSGNSNNVLKAIEYAKENGAITIGLVGYDGGKLKNIVDYNIHININNMQITEDLHMILDHMMMYILCH